MTESHPPRRVLPPFEKTLAGIAGLRESSDFSATIGREALSETLVATPSVGTTRGALPTVSIDLGSSSPGAVHPSHGADLLVVGKLGEGGMGVVHLAEQRSLDRLVAVKTTRAEVGAAADAALCEEAIVTGRLEHPNIVPVHAFGRTIDGRAALVMKRIEGVAWRTLMLEPNHEAWAAIATDDRLVDHLRILVQVANALSFAHSKGVVHRDVKPENVLVGSYGEVLLVDFGLAVRTDKPWPDEPKIVGTPAYMAPEMVAGLPVDARTDVYLLGASLHEVLTGNAPHDGYTLTAVLANAYASAPPAFDAEIPHELADICRRAMARDAEDRYPTARHFRAAISDYLAHRASHQLADRAAERLRHARESEVIAERRAALTEARFACRQAIDGWPENLAARATERDATIDAIALEIDERNAAGARAVLDILVDPPSGLVDRLRSLEAAIDAERRDAARLVALERDLDISVGAGTRMWAMIILAVFAGFVGQYVVRRSDQVGLRPIDLLRYGGLMLIVVSVVLGLAWRRVAVNAIGRKLAIVAWMSSVALMTHRVAGYVANEPIPAVLSGDMIIFATMTAVGGVLVDARLFFGLPIMLVGAFVAAAVPTAAPIAFSGATLLLLVVAAWYFRNMQKSKDAG